MDWPPHDPAPSPLRAAPCPWDQRPDEETDAFLAFSDWLVRAPGEAYPWTSSTRRWAAQHRWRARRAAYAQSLAATSARAAHEKAADMGARHAEALRDLFDLGHEALARYAGQDLSPRDALAMLKIAIELERLRAGEPGSITHANLSTASDEDLEALDRALERIERKRADS